MFKNLPLNFLTVCCAWPGTWSRRGLVANTAGTTQMSTAMARTETRMPIVLRSLPSTSVHPLHLNFQISGRLNAPTFVSLNPLSEVDGSVGGQWAFVFHVRAIAVVGLFLACLATSAAAPTGPAHAQHHEKSADSPFTAPSGEKQGRSTKVKSKKSIEVCNV
uniref:Uncharacterized protein n=1 Tax=Heliothis virescens TaxID=7102 RepID=A0A2A4IXL9_HELVI